MPFASLSFYMCHRLHQQSLGLVCSNVDCCNFSSFFQIRNDFVVVKAIILYFAFSFIVLFIISPIIRFGAYDSLFPITGNICFVFEYFPCSCLGVLHYMRVTKIFFGGSLSYLCLMVYKIYSVRLLSTWWSTESWGADSEEECKREYGKRNSPNNDRGIFLSHYSYHYFYFQKMETIVCEYNGKIMEWLLGIGKVMLCLWRR